MDILELLKEGSPTVILLACVLFAIRYLVLYVKKQQEESRADIKDMQQTYRKDIGDLLDSAKVERTEQRVSMEKMVHETNTVVSGLSIAVKELQVIVQSKMK